MEIPKQTKAYCTYHIRLQFTWWVTNKEELVTNTTKQMSVLPFKMNAETRCNYKSKTWQIVKTFIGYLNTPPIQFAAQHNTFSYIFIF